MSRLINNLQKYKNGRSKSEDWGRPSFQSIVFDSLPNNANIYFPVPATVTYHNPRLERCFTLSAFIERDDAVSVAVSVSQLVVPIDTGPEVRQFHCVTAVLGVDGWLQIQMVVGWCVEAFRL